MEQLYNLNRRLRSSSKGNSLENGKQTPNSTAQQQRLDEIGGEPLVGSEFESEDPESDFEPTGEES